MAIGHPNQRITASRATHLDDPVAPHDRAAMDPRERFAREPFGERGKRLIDQFNPLAGVHLGIVTSRPDPVDRVEGYEAHAAGNTGAQRLGRQGRLDRSPLSPPAPDDHARDDRGALHGRPFALPRARRREPDAADR